MTEPGSFDGAPQTTLAARVEQYLRRLGRDPGTVQIEPLAGDASTRVYLRLRDPDGASSILAAHPAPFDPDTLPQLVVGRLFERLGIPIPRVRGQAGDLGLLALEDLGDVTLQDWLATKPSDPLSTYRTALELVAKLQLGAAEHQRDQQVPFTLAFDVAKGGAISVLLHPMVHGPEIGCKVSQLSVVSPVQRDPLTNPRNGKCVGGVHQ